MGDPGALAAYAAALAPMAAELGVAAPEPGPFNDDHYAAHKFRPSGLSADAARNGAVM